MLQICSTLLAVRFKMWEPGASPKPAQIGLWPKLMKMSFSPPCELLTVFIITVTVFHDWKGVASLYLCSFILLNDKLFERNYTHVDTKKGTLGITTKDAFGVESLQKFAFPAAFSVLPFLECQEFYLRQRSNDCFIFKTALSSTAL